MKYSIGPTIILCWIIFTPATSMNLHNASEWYSTTISTYIKNATTTSPILTVLQHAKAINTIVINAAGTQALTASDDGTAQLWNVHSGDSVATFKHDGPVASAFFCNNDVNIITASHDHTAKLWEIKTGSCIATFRHQAPVTWAVCSNDNALVLTTAADGTAHLWNKQHIRTIVKNNNLFVAVFAWNSFDIITFFKNHSYAIWKTDSNKDPITHHIMEYNLYSLAEMIDSDHTYLLVTSNYNPPAKELSEQEVYEAREEYNQQRKIDRFLKKELLKRNPSLYYQNKHHPKKPDFNPYAATNTLFTIFNIMDDNTSEIKNNYEFQDPINTFDISPCGNFMLLAHNNGNVNLWHIPSSNKLFSFQDKAPITWATFSPDGRYIAMANTDGCAKIWPSPAFFTQDVIKNPFIFAYKIPRLVT